MPPLADQLRWLIGTLHGQYSDVTEPPARAAANRRRLIGALRRGVNYGAPLMRIVTRQSGPSRNMLGTCVCFDSGH
jgi:hypothetical protein